MGHNDEFHFLHKPFSPSQLFNAINATHRLDQLGIHQGNQTIQFENQPVLVVEDNAINREVIGEMLKQFNLNPHFAENGQAGVDAVKATSYDLVLMDIQMPVMDGYKATEIIRRFDADLPIIALTAAAMIEDKQRALDAGMNAHLAKPIELKALQNQLMQHLSWHPVTPTTNPHSGDASPAIEVANQSPPPDKTQDVLQQEKPVILIVDDEPANARILANGLKDDYKLLIANSGEKALARAAKHPKPDLILLDIVMPGMDGYDACKALKNDPQTQDIPVIFVSALDQAEDEEKGLDLGAVDFIAKPFHLPIVRSRVRNHISLKLKADLLDHLSHMDGLTHIANRRQFDEQLETESHRLARHRKPLGLIMIDIDFFKAFNDHYGHGQGDVCLQKVAHTLNEHIQRPTDLLARYGGEEFVVMLPETDAAGVESVAQTLRQAIADLEVPHAFSSAADHVTISVGGAAHRIDRPEQAAALLTQADEALYQAKKQGRNRVIIQS
jgi:diguanylate cyclase (GGDEF)-like protein